MKKQKTQKTKKEKKLLKKDDYLDLTQTLPKQEQEESSEIIEEIIDIPAKSKIHSQEIKQDGGTGKVAIKGIPADRVKIPDVTNPIPEKVSFKPKNKKMLLIIGISALILLIISTGFFVYAFYTKDFNSTVNVQTPDVNVNPTNTFTIVNNNTIMTDIDPIVISNILGNISAIKDKLNMS